MSQLQSHHVGISVSDLDRCETFYRDELGFEVVDRFTVSGETFSTVVGVDGASGRFVHLDANGTLVELVEYEPAVEPLDDAELHRPGTGHVGFTVTDLDTFVDELSTTVDVRVGPVTTESGTRLCFFRDPEGNQIEVLEA